MDGVKWMVKGMVDGWLMDGSMVVQWQFIGGVGMVDGEMNSNIMV